MNNSTATSRSPEYSSKAGLLPSIFLEDCMVVADIAVGTCLGYLAIHFYYHIVGHAFLVGSLGLVAWRQIILVSVIAALIVRKTELPAEYVSAKEDVRSTVLGVLGRALCAGTVLLAIGVVTGAFADLARLWLLAWSLLLIGWLCFSRILLLFHRRQICGRNDRKPTIAIVGARRSLSALAARLAEGACVKTLIDHSSLAGHDLADAVTNLVCMARDGVIELVVLASETEERPQELARILECLKAAPVRVALWQSMICAASDPVNSVSIAGVAMSLIAERPLSRRDMFVKTLVDKFGALLLLLLALPLLVAITAVIVVETGGPIIFKQRRNGWCGCLFTVYKFRSMRHAPGQYVLYQTERGDPRCTRIGAFLRRTSLDELPQLWNVLRGDMSLVGPRPHADFMHARERANCGPVEDYVQRQRVKPGLTGWAQVHGLRGAADTPEKLRQRVEFDRYYIENWSVWLDVKILLQTPFAVFSRENAF